MAIPILFSGSYSAPSGGGGDIDPTSTAFNSPIDSDNSAKVLAAWSPDRMYDTFSGNSLSVERASDNTSQAASFNSDGELNTGDIISHCSGTTGHLDSLTCQMGSGNALSPKASGILPVIDGSGNLTRTGPTRNASTGVIDSLSATNGAPLIKVDAYANTAQVNLTGITGTDSMEFHVVRVHHDRKGASSKIDAQEPTTDTGEETIFQYNFGTSYLRASVCPNSTITHYGYLNFGSGLGSDQISDTDYPVIEKNGTRIQSWCIHPTEFFQYIDGRKIDVRALNSTAQSTITGGALDEGTLYIGQRSSGGTSQTPNFSIYAVIVTEQLTDAERERLHLRLGEAVNQHRLLTLTAFKNKFTHINWAGNMNGVTGVSPAVKGNLAIKANVNTTINGDTPTHTLTHTTSTGWKGIRCDDGTNNANTWKDTGGVGPNLTAMSVVLLHVREGTQGTNLRYPICWSTDDWESSVPSAINGSNKNTDFSVAMGDGHNVPQSQMSVAASLDTNGICGSVDTDNPDALGGQVSQPNGKYNDTLGAGTWNDHVDTVNVNTLASDVESREVNPSGVTYPSGTKLTNATMDAALNLVAPTAENATNPGSDMKFYIKPQDMAMLQCMVINSGTSYDHAESQTNRDPHMLSGDTTLYNIPAVGSGFYSTACQVAERDGNAPVLHISSGSKLQPAIYQQFTEGTTVFVGIYEGEFTATDFEEIAANLRYIYDGSLAA